MSDKYPGCHGTIQHHEIVDDVRFEIARAMRKEGFDLGICADEQAYNLVLGWDKVGKEDMAVRSQRVPDLVITDNWLCPTSRVVIEVGRFNPDKWPNTQPVIHIGFNRQSALLNSTGHWFEVSLLSHIRAFYEAR